MRLKTIARSEPVLNAMSAVFAGYMALVRGTARLTREPADTDAAIAAAAPAIVAMWHGQHLMIPAVVPRSVSFKALLARHIDAEVNARAIARFGHGVIRASAAGRPEDIRKKGGVEGFLTMVRALRQGVSVGMTADVPKGPARIAGAGIVRLASHSGLPVVPLAFATRWRITFHRQWDKASFNLPFSRAAFIVGEPIRVPPKLAEDEVEVWQKAITDGLDRATTRAYAIVDGKR
jgi:lysophospholipid acyltransferase (LPLAT)-like uncharacterized protein